MKVLHVVGGRLDDGAARGAVWLHRGLRACGVESRILVRRAPADDRSITTPVLGPGERLLWRLGTKVDHLRLNLYPRRQTRTFSVGRFGLDITRQPAYAWADVINLHWVGHGMASIRRLASIDKPLVWTLRDMWPFTGGCHYAIDCDRYTIGCGTCPQLGSRRKHDVSAASALRKRRFVPPQTVLVGISRWMGDCARASAALGHLDIRVIPNSIDTDLFSPVPKAEARARLQLPADARIVLSGSLDPRNFYKGYDLWQAAAADLAGDAVLFVRFGGHRPHPQDPSRLRVFGLVRNDSRLRDLYAAADVFVMPSRQEAFGKTAAEALACGTPVVAFDATGPRDIVSHGVTGYLARPFDPIDLADGVRWVLADPERAASLGRAAAYEARARFARSVAATRYRELYREIIARARAAQARAATSAALPVDWELSDAMAADD